MVYRTEYHSTTVLWSYRTIDPYGSRQTLFSMLIYLHMGNYIERYRTEYYQIGEEKRVI